MKKPYPNTHGRVMDTSVSDRPSFFRMMYWGTTMTCEGIIIVITMQPNQKFAPLNFRRETAYAASREQKMVPVTDTTVTMTLFRVNRQNGTPAMPCQPER